MAESYLFPVAVGTSLTTTTSFVTVPGLSFTVVAGATYRFEAHLQYQGSSTSASFRPSMGGTCTPTVIDYHIAIQTNANGTSNHQTHNALSPSSSGATAVNAATTNYGCKIQGLLVVATGGTFTTQASHVTAACTVQSGGRMLLEQVA